MNRKLRVLLIGEDPQGSSYLTARLRKQGCELESASSCKEAYSRINTRNFDLVLSTTRLRDGGTFSLMDFFGGSQTTLFYFYPVEDGCWWLPALRRGQRCFGSSALRPSEFVSALDEAIEEMKSEQETTENAQQGPLRTPAVSIAAASSPNRELEAAGLTRSESLPMAKREVAG